ncbi:MAG: hypothetical protein V1820_05840 [archaeon]
MAPARRYIVRDIEDANEFAADARTGRGEHFGFFHQGPLLSNAARKEALEKAWEHWNAAYRGLAHYAGDSFPLFTHPILLFRVLAAENAVKYADGSLESELRANYKQPVAV